MGGHDATTFDTTVDDRFVNEELVPRAVAVTCPSRTPDPFAWAGLYEMTPDRLPVVGPAPVDGLWIAAGFSGHGFQHGPIVGTWSRIDHGSPTSVDVSALSFNRFGAGELTSERHVV
jgi:glycine/D-amino acid oxidase-like deaminating enzyme